MPRGANKSLVGRSVRVTQCTVRNQPVWYAKRIGETFPLMPWRGESTRTGAWRTVDSGEGQLSYIHVDDCELVE